MLNERVYLLKYTLRTLTGPKEVEHLCNLADPCVEVPYRKQCASVNENPLRKECTNGEQ